MAESETEDTLNRGPQADREDAPHSKPAPKFEDNQEIDKQAGREESAECLPSRSMLSGLREFLDRTAQGERAFPELNLASGLRAMLFRAVEDPGVANHDRSEQLGGSVSSDPFLGPAKRPAAEPKGLSPSRANDEIGRDPRAHRALPEVTREPNWEDLARDLNLLKHSGEPLRAEWYANEGRSAER